MGLDPRRGLHCVSENGDFSASCNQNARYDACYESSATFPPIATVLTVSVRSVAKRNR